MVKKHWCFAEQGSFHRENNKPCEDKVISGKRGGMHYVALADGAGSLKYSAEGAECAVHAIVEYVSDNFERLLSESMMKAKYLIVDHVLYALKKKADGRNLKEFGSTLLFVGVKNGKYIMFHLGDGGIIAGNERFQILSRPMNGETKTHTFLTTTKDVYKFTRLERGIVQKEHFAVVSDGCYDIFCNKNVGQNFWGNIVSIKYDKEKVKTLIKSCTKSKDDYSISFMSIA